MRESRNPSHGSYTSSSLSPQPPPLLPFSLARSLAPSPPLVRPRARARARSRFSLLLVLSCLLASSRTITLSLQRCQILRDVEIPELIDSLESNHTMLLSSFATIERARSLPLGISPPPPPLPKPRSFHEMQHRLSLWVCLRLLQGLSLSSPLHRPSAVL